VAQVTSRAIQAGLAHGNTNCLEFFSSYRCVWLCSQWDADATGAGGTYRCCPWFSSSQGGCMFLS